jgi:hypothetical protein
MNTTQESPSLRMPGVEEGDRIFAFGTALQMPEARDQGPGKVRCNGWTGAD